MVLRLSGKISLPSKRRMFILRLHKFGTGTAVPGKQQDFHSVVIYVSTGAAAVL